MKDTDKTPSPHEVQRHRAFGRALALHRAGRRREAFALYARLLRAEPDRADILTNMGALLRTAGRSAAAATLHRRAATIDPDNAVAWGNLGNALRDLNRLDEAAEALETALALSNDRPSARYNLALLYRDMGRLDAAVAHFDAVLADNPDHVGGHWDRSLALLLKGDLLEGFAEYEWRWKLDEAKRHPFPGPEWDGNAMPGKTLLVYHEQGFGDTIQFARYLPLVKAMGMRVVFFCQDPLIPVIRTLEGVDEIVPSTSGLPPDYDVHAAILTLPRLFATTLETIVADTPYLSPPDDIRAPVLSPTEGNPLRVGIAWAGKPSHKNDRNRSCPLEEFLPLLAVPGTRFYSLQKGPRAADLRSVGIAGIVGDLDPVLENFGVTAHIMAQLDLVITVDTAVAHIAGALGRPVWVAMPLVPDWRWMFDRDDSPWYPSMTLYRQQRQGEWPDAFARIAADLAAMAAARDCAMK